MFQQTSEKTVVAIKDRQLRETGYIEHETQNENKQNKNHQTGN